MNSMTQELPAAQSLSFQGGANNADQRGSSVADFTGYHAQGRHASSFDSQSRHVLEAAITIGAAIDALAYSETDQHGAAGSAAGDWFNGYYSIGGVDSGSTVIPNSQIGGGVSWRNFLQSYTLVESAAGSRNNSRGEGYRQRDVTASGHAETTTANFAASTRVATGSYLVSEHGDYHYHATLEGSAQYGAQHGDGVYNGDGTFALAEDRDSVRDRTSTGTHRTVNESLRSAGFSHSAAGSTAQGGAHLLDTRIVSIADHQTTHDEFNETGPDLVHHQSESNGHYDFDADEAHTLLATESFGGGGAQGGYVISQNALMVADAGA